jgi:hypothetical protein
MDTTIENKNKERLFDKAEEWEQLGFFLDDANVFKANEIKESVFADDSNIELNDKIFLEPVLDMKVDLDIALQPEQDVTDLIFDEHNKEDIFNVNNPGTNDISNLLDR